MKLAIAALLKALRDRNFVPISIMSNGEDAITLCVDAMRSRGVRFSLAGLGQHVPNVEKSIRTIKRSEGF